MIHGGLNDYRFCSHHILPSACYYACTNINTEELAHLPRQPRYDLRHHSVSSFELGLHTTFSKSETYHRKQGNMRAYTIGDVDNKLISPTFAKKSFEQVLQVRIHFIRKHQIIVDNLQLRKIQKSFQQFISQLSLRKYMKLELNLLALSYVSWSVSPRNGYCPNTIQYKVTPTAHVSAGLPW